MPTPLESVSGCVSKFEGLGCEKDCSMAVVSKEGGVSEKEKGRGLDSSCAKMSVRQFSMALCLMP